MVKGPNEVDPADIAAEVTMFAIKPIKTADGIPLEDCFATIEFIHPKTGEKGP